MNEALKDLIAVLIIRWVGALCLWAAYNAIAYEFNLPSFTVWIPFCLVCGFHFSFKRITNNYK